MKEYNKNKNEQSRNKENHGIHKMGDSLDCLKNRKTVIFKVCAYASSIRLSLDRQRANQSVSQDSELDVSGAKQDA